MKPDSFGGEAGCRVKERRHKVEKHKMNQLSYDADPLACNECDVQTERRAKKHIKMYEDVKRINVQRKIAGKKWIEMDRIGDRRCQRLEGHLDELVRTAIAEFRFEVAKEVSAESASGRPGRTAGP